MRASKDAIIAFDATGQVIAANDAARIVIDVDATSLGEVLGPLATAHGRTDAPGHAIIEATELQLRSLPDRWFQLTIYAGGENDGASIAIIRDVTDTRRDEAIGEIIPTLISHELRTPMASIYAAAEILQRDRGRPLDDEQAELVHDVSTEMRRLQLLVDDLTVLSRQDSELGLDRQPVLLQRLLPDMVASQRRRYRDDDIELRIQDEPPIVAADRYALEHVFSDLIAVALQRSPGGPVNVMLGSHSRGGAVVRVRDGGPSYRDTERRLLGPLGFAHLPADRSGSAISLHVAYRLVAAVGGRIWARSTEPGGEIGFWLPPMESNDMPHVQ